MKITNRLMMDVVQKKVQKTLSIYNQSSAILIEKHVQHQELGYNLQNDQKINLERNDYIWGTVHTLMKRRRVVTSMIYRIISWR